MGKYTITDVFKTAAPNLKFDKTLYTKLKLFRIGWMNRSSVHADFLGGNTLGVHPIRFTINDDEELLSNVFEVDKEDIVLGIKRVTEIDDSWKVSSNPIYQLLIYTMHGYSTSKGSKQLIEDTIIELYLIFSYKVMGSLVSWYFSRYDADYNVAKTVYERLSGRYLIKKFHTWQKVFEYKAQDLMGPKGIHAKRLIHYDADDTVYIINDIQGKLRSTVKNIHAVIREVEAEKSGLAINAAEVEIEGTKHLREVIDRPDIYVSFIRSIVNSEYDFIKRDLINLIIRNITPNVDKDMVMDTLQGISEDMNFSNSRDDYIIEDCIVTSIRYLTTKDISSGYANDIIGTLKQLRGFWVSSKTKDKTSKRLKKDLSKFIYKITKRKTKSVIITTYITVFLYIFLRAVTREIYK